MKAAYVRMGWQNIKVDLSERKITTLDTEPYSERFIGGLGIGENCTGMKRR